MVQLSAAGRYFALSLLLIPPVTVSRDLAVGHLNLPVPQLMLRGGRGFLVVQNKVQRPWWRKRIHAQNVAAGRPVVDRDLMLILK